MTRPLRFIRSGLRFFWRVYVSLSVTYFTTTLIACFLLVLIPLTALGVIKPPILTGLFYRPPSFDLGVSTPPGFGLTELERRASRSFSPQTGRFEMTVSEGEITGVFATLLGDFRLGEGERALRLNRPQVSFLPERFITTARVEPVGLGVRLEGNLLLSNDQKAKIEIERFCFESICGGENILEEILSDQLKGLLSDHPLLKSLLLEEIKIERGSLTLTGRVDPTLF